jgi:excisionase family DNA binding protein
MIMKSSTVEKPQAEWLGLRHVTQYASVSERTLRAWIHSPVDPLPAVRVSGKILVRRSELDAWLQRHRVQRLESLDLDGLVKGVLQGLADGR